MHQKFGVTKTNFNESVFSLVALFGSKIDNLKKEEKQSDQFKKELNIDTQHIFMHYMR